MDGMGGGGLGKDLKWGMKKGGVCVGGGGSTCGRGWLRKQSETLRIRPHLLLVTLQPFLELLTSPSAL